MNSIVWLYVLIFMSGDALRSDQQRVAMPDMATCERALKSARTEATASPERAMRVVMFCGSDHVETRGYMRGKIGEYIAWIASEKRAP